MKRSLGESNSLNFLLETGPQPRLSFPWAQVTSVDPLRVQLDMDSSPLALTPDTLEGGLSEGDRVRMLIQGTYAMVIGRAGGSGPWLLGSEDLNDVLTTGHYVQGRNDTPSAARHYPFNRAGWLQVVNAPDAGAGGLIFQTYQEYGRSGYAQVRRAWRSWSRGSWSEWQVHNAVLIDAGWVSVTPPSGGGWGSARVNFNIEFPSTPTITLTAHSGATTVREVTIGATDVNGFEARMHRTTQVTTTISWQAVLPNN